MRLRGMAWLSLLFDSNQVWRGGKNVVRDYRGGGLFWVRAIFGIPPAPPAVNNDHSLNVHGQTPPGSLNCIKAS